MIVLRQENNLYEHLKLRKKYNNNNNNNINKLQIIITNLLYEMYTCFSFKPVVFDNSTKCYETFITLATN